MIEVWLKGKHMERPIIEMWDWCDNNCLGKWDRTRGLMTADVQELKYIFELETDAKAFKLRWL